VEYIIHDRTLALTETESNYYRTKVYETNKVIYRKEDPLTIIKNSCKHYGYHYSAWNKLVKKILGRNSKLPVPIKPSNALFFVPTTSHHNKDCTWISYYKVIHYMERNNKLKIVLNDGQTISTDISLNQFKLQMKRTGSIIAYFYPLLHDSKN